jgi:hypothetical protein
MIIQTVLQDAFEDESHWKLGTSGIAATIPTLWKPTRVDNNALGLPGIARGRFN